jgi:hypothetical protein
MTALVEASDQLQASGALPPETVNVKFTLEHAMKAPEGEQSYSPIFPLTSALDGVGGQRHAPAAFTPRKDPVPIV